MAGIEMSGTRKDVREHNRAAWDALVEQGNEWTVPVSPEVIEAARHGRWEIVLTPTKPVPRNWLEVEGRHVLCLASGGGQQAPILAAAGATVTVLDNSPRQLDRDAKMAGRHGLPNTTVLGDMANLEMFGDDSFDLIVHPCSNCFVPDVLPVWREAFRVLRRGGCLVAGFANPAMYLFDLDLADTKGMLEVRHPLPFSDGPRGASEPMEFSHSLELQIGGQIAAGFSIIGLYEDAHVGGDSNVLNKYMPMFIATRALKGA
jgi:SAM-dependent methyltransferase